MPVSLEQALVEALNDEYKARATYAQVIRKFGEVRPFANILHAEDRHVHALLPLFDRYGIPVPGDTWPQRVAAPSSLLEASRAGVQAEIENAAMYTRLLTATRDYPDVQQVLLNLQRASQENHLPAFQRAVQRLESRHAPAAPHTAGGCHGGGRHRGWGGGSGGGRNRGRNPRQQ